MCSSAYHHSYLSNTSLIERLVANISQIQFLARVSQPMYCQMVNFIRQLVISVTKVRFLSRVRLPVSLPCVVLLSDLLRKYDLSSTRASTSVLNLTGWIVNFNFFFLSQIENVDVIIYILYSLSK